MLLPMPLVLALLAAVQESPALPDVGGDELPLRMTSYVLGEGSEGRSRVVVVAEADPGALTLESRDGRAIGALDVRVSLTPRDGGSTDTQESSTEISWDPDTRARMEATWLPLRRVWELGPGVYEARMAVRDRGSGRAGSVVHRFEVPEVAAFRVTTPILTDVAAADGEASALIARRSFAPGARILLQFEVRGAAVDTATGAPRVRVGHELRRGPGTIAARSEPVPIAPGPDGRLSMSLAVQPRLPGPAEFRISAFDEVSGKSVEVRESFSIDADAPAPPAQTATAPAPPPAPPAPVGAAIPPVSPGVAGLRQLTALYRSGQAVPAASSLARWEPRDRRESLRSLAREAAADPGLQIAAALIVTEAAFARAGHEKGELDEARGVLEQVRDPSRREAALRLWLVVAGERYQHTTRFDDAEGYFRECLRRDPSDPRASLALGSILELRGSLGLVARNPLGGPSVPLGSESLVTLRAKSGRATDLERAEAAYRKALEDPATGPEAKLRLGRTLQLAGRSAAALPALEAASKAADPRVKALALLFLSRLENASLPRARAAYAALPESQTVAIGFAHALSRAGRRDEAAGVVSDALRSPSASMDVWLAYQLGAIDTSALDALRRSARE